MDPTWPPLYNVLKDQGEDAIIRAEPRVMVGAGRGLFATQKLDPLQTVVSIPGCLLLNAKTLSKTYPSRIPPRTSIQANTRHTYLTSVQLISLHLYRWRGGLSDPTFDTYIATLPDSFSDHPLTMIVSTASNKYILDLMPASVAKMLLEVEKRLKDDWDIIVKILKKYPSLVPPLDDGSARDLPPRFEDFIWAWLNVNTRCLYHKLGFRKSEDNITMCPLLDFANHTHLQSMSITQDEFALSDGMAFSSSRYLYPGDQVYLRYGAHSNALLFTEYGFVLSRDIKDTHTISGETLIDMDVEELFGSCEHAQEKTQILKDRNYWGDWTLHVEDGTGRPSFRLLPALRLLHISLGSKSTSDLELWEDSLIGIADIVSQENEAKTRETIILLCDKIISRSNKSIPLVQSEMASLSSARQDGTEDHLQILSMVRVLWEEERQVAERVQKAVLEGIEF